MAMQLEQKTVVFLDLDGTFWEGRVVPPSALEAVRRATAKGHKVLTNTGRTRAEVGDMSQFGLSGFCFGAGSEAELEGVHVVDEPLGVATAHLIEDHLRRLGISYLAEGSHCCYRHFFGEAMIKKMQGYLDAAARTGDPFLSCPEVEEMDEAAYAQIYKYSIFIDGESTPETVPNLPEGFVFTPLFDGGGEITQAHITKASAVRAVRDYLQRDGSSWRTMAFGDSNNDLPMLHAADVGVCMGNGNEVAKAAADYITAPIDEDGLLRAFEHFGLV